MKTKLKTFIILLAMIIGTLCISCGTSILFKKENNNVEEYVYISRNENLKENKVSDEVETINTDTEVDTISFDLDVLEEVEKQEKEKEIVYEGKTLNEIAEQLNRSLKSTIAGQGYLIASYSIENGVDPYLATAIMLHETGCNWKCSNLVNSCNNVGGQVGTPSCGGGRFRAFDTLEDGIKGMISNLAINYYAYGLNTPELMQNKYAASTTWAEKVNTYIYKLKAN